MVIKRYSVAISTPFTFFLFRVLHSKFECQQMFLPPIHSSPIYSYHDRWIVVERSFFCFFVCLLEHAVLIRLCNIRKMCLVVLKVFTSWNVYMSHIHQYRDNVKMVLLFPSGNLFKCYHELECAFFFSLDRWINLHSQTIPENLPRYPYGAHTIPTATKSCNFVKHSQKLLTKFVRFHK